MELSKQFWISTARWSSPSLCSDTDELLIPVFSKVKIVAAIYQNPREKRRAERNSNILSELNIVIKDPILLFETVCMWSRFMAQFLIIPFAFDSETSEGMFRIVDVMGATVISPRNSNAESLVRITTGRFLSGFANIYHLISPLLISQSKSVQFPNR